MTTRLTHRERKQRRRLMADDIKSGKSVIEVAHKYTVSPDTVYLACQEFRVAPPGMPRGSKGSMNSFQVLKYLVDGHAEADLARKFNLSRQYINQVKQRAIAGGFTELLKLPQSRKKASLGPAPVPVSEPLDESALESLPEPLPEPQPELQEYDHDRNGPHYDENEQAAGDAPGPADSGDCDLPDPGDRGAGGGDVCNSFARTFDDSVPR